MTNYAVQLARDLYRALASALARADRPGPIATAERPGAAQGGPFGIEQLRPTRVFVRLAVRFVGGRRFIRQAEALPSGIQAAERRADSGEGARRCVPDGYQDPAERENPEEGDQIDPGA